VSDINYPPDFPELGLNSPAVHAEMDDLDFPCESNLAYLDRLWKDKAPHPAPQPTMDNGSD